MEKVRYQVLGTFELSGYVARLDAATDTTREIMDKLNNDADIVNCEVRIKSFAVEEAAESKQAVRTKARY